MYKTMLLVVGFFSIFVANAATEPPPKNFSYLFYIQPAEYQHPVRLWRYYYDYWFMQGPALEKAALQVFGNQASICATDRNGDALIWLRPKMFYHPQLQQYQVNIVANVYTAKARPIATFEADAVKVGFLDVATEQYATETYRLALNKILTSIRSDSSLATELKKDANEHATPCTLTDTLPEPSVRFMSF